MIEVGTTALIVLKKEIKPLQMEKTSNIQTSEKLVFSFEEKRNVSLRKRAVDRVCMH